MSLERLTMNYKEYWGYHWRVTNRRRIPGIFRWDEQLVDLIETVCCLKPGSRILDLGCGGGDQVKVFARKGHFVTGIDIVPALVDHARQAFQTEGLPGEFIAGDMRDITDEDRFDLVVILSGSFGFFSDLQNRELLGKIRRALKPGGAAFIDYLPIEKYARINHERNWMEMDSGYALSEEWFDVSTSTYRSRHIHILLNGRIIEAADEEGYGANEVIRCYSAPEMENLAADAGFTVAAHLTRNHIGNPDYKARDDEPRGMIVLGKGLTT